MARGRAVADHVELEWYRCSCGFVAVDGIALRRHIRHALKAQEGAVTDG